MFKSPFFAQFSVQTKALQKETLFGKFPLSAGAKIPCDLLL